MDVVIVGAGGHGKVVLDILRAAGRCNPVGFIDSAASLAGKAVSDLPVLGPSNLLPRLRHQGVRHAIIAIGDNRTRMRYARHLLEQGFDLVSAVHPAAFVSPRATIGCNVVVAPQAAIITEARVADSAIINTGCVVDHECDLAAGVHVGPGAHLAGRVRVGEGSFVGLGANVIQCLSIGRYATVGSGAVVTKDVPDFATVAGVPARMIRLTPVADDDTPASVAA